MAHRRHFRFSRWVGRLRADSTGPITPTTPTLTTPRRVPAPRRVGALASSAALALGVLALPAQAV
ncbi:hypothetical protein, partial [Micromonospora sp. ATA51]